MGYWEGLLGGFLDRKYGVEAENRRQGELAQERERAIFNTLLSSEDPETQQIALAGLLDSANPRRKAGGLRGWIGETLESPHLARIRALSPTVAVPEEYTATLPGLPAIASGMPQALPGAVDVGQGGQVTPTLATPPPEPSGAMPATSPVQPGAPLSLPTGYTVGPPTPARLTRMAMRTRNMLPTPESIAFRKAIAEGRAEMATAEMRRRAGFPVPGDVGGEIRAKFDAVYESAVRAGEPPESARQMALSAVGGLSRRGVGEGNVHQDADGNWVQDLYDASGRVVASIPAPPPRQAGTRAPNAQEIEASRLFGHEKPGEDPRDTLLRIAGLPDSAARLKAVQDAVAAQAGTVAGAQTTGRGQAAAVIPLSREQRAAEVTRLRNEWTTASAPARDLASSVLTMETALKTAERDPKNTAPAFEAIQLTYQKMLDPGSVVREGEFWRSASGQPLLVRAQGIWDRLKTGGFGIPLDELRAYVTVSKEIADAKKSFADSKRVAIQRTIDNNQLDPVEIFGTDVPPPTPKAQPGTTTAPALMRDANGNIIFKPR